MVDEIERLQAAISPDKELILKMAQSYTHTYQENERLRAALLDISSRHIPDCPALFWGDPVDWAERQHTELRRLARAALEGEKKDIMRTLVDKINQQAIAIAERDEFIEIMGMCNEFEEFLSK